MKLASDWFKSKVLWTATVPALVTAWQAWSHGQMTWWQALLAGVAGTGAFGLRDMLARHQEELNKVARLVAGLQQVTTSGHAAVVEAVRGGDAEKAALQARVVSQAGMLDGFRGADLLKVLGPMALDKLTDLVHDRVAKQVLKGLEGVLAGGSPGGAVAAVVGAVEAAVEPDGEADGEVAGG